MKIQFEIPDAVFKAAQRYTLDPVEHAASMFEHWAQLAQQQHPGVDLMTLPTLAVTAKQAEADRLLAAQHAEIAQASAAQQQVKEQAAAQLLTDEQAAATAAAQQADVEARAIVLAKAMMQTLAQPAEPRPALEAAAAMMAKPQAKADA